jgi:hypothetical protein
MWIPRGCGMDDRDRQRLERGERREVFLRPTPLNEIAH